MIFGFTYVKSLMFRRIIVILAVLYCFSLNIEIQTNSLKKPQFMLKNALT